MARQSDSREPVPKLLTPALTSLTIWKKAERSLARFFPLNLEEDVPMLPPFIIEQIRKREEEERARYEQPQLEIERPRPRPRIDVPPDDTDGHRGVIILEL